MSNGYIGRHIEAELDAALADTPVVLIAGARRVGKSTLAHRVAERRSLAYLTLDDSATRMTAAADPAGFVGDIEVPAVIDEVQRVPELFLAIKKRVDDARLRGEGREAMFVLTGSAQIWTSLRVADSLAGRIERLPLRPLSQGELRGVRETFVDDLFAGTLPQVHGAQAGRSVVSELIVRGGYPEAVEREAQRRRRAWLESYIATIVERDVRDLAQIQALNELPSLLKALAARAGGLLNMTSIGSELGLDRKTATRYLALLETVFLVHRVPAWRRNVGRRLIKSPKVWLIDTGLASYLLDYDAKRIETDDTRIAGGLFESFVGQELLKQASWSDTRARIYHYRTTGDVEVDIVLESDSGDVCGVEAKLSATLDERDFRGLRQLKEATGDRFRSGVVLYTGAEALPFGDRLWALPISTLWTPS